MEELGTQLSRRALAWHARSGPCSPQHHTHTELREDCCVTQEVSPGRSQIRYLHKDTLAHLQRRHCSKSQQVSAAQRPPTDEQ